MTRQRARHASATGAAMESPTSWELGRGRRTRQWVRIRRRVLVRDGMQCQRCGVDLHDGAPSTDPLQATVGHVRPLALGGDPLDIDNLRAECRRCNVGDSSRIRAAKAARGRELRRARSLDTFGAY